MVGREDNDAVFPYAGLLEGGYNPSYIGIHQVESLEICGGVPAQVMAIVVGMVESQHQEIGFLFDDVFLSIRAHQGVIIILGFPVQRLGAYAAVQPVPLVEGADFRLGILLPANGKDACERHRGFKCLDVLGGAVVPLFYRVVEACQLRTHAAEHGGPVLVACSRPD